MGSSERQRLVVGLDFGTTYSSIAWSDSQSATSTTDVVQLLQEWLGQNSDGQKVPSRISYGVPPAHQIEWGYQIKPNTKATVHALMKLRLDEVMARSKQLKLLVRFLTAQMSGLDLLDASDEDDEDGPCEYPGKAPVDIVADYLTQIRKHFYEQLQRRYTSTLFNAFRIGLVVTVPAVWSERAKDLTLKAVSKADFKADLTSLVTEPEAAAVFTLKWMMESANKDSMRAGDYFVLCDCGGGTVDIISYKIMQVSPIFKIEEAAVGSGDKCGATYVDKEFMSWLQQLVGEEAYKKVPDPKTRHGSPLMNAFETMKHHFDGDEDTMEITLPREIVEDDESKQIDDGVFTISNSQLKEIFNPCINRILELIDGQVDSVMNRSAVRSKAILLFGGFGRN